MIAGHTPKPHLRSRPTSHIPIIIRPDTNFWHRPQISAPSEIKTQRNWTNCMQISSPKVHLSKTIHDWLRPLRIVPYRAIIYAFFSKRDPMMVTWYNFVNNTLIASKQVYRRSRYCLQNKIDQVTVIGSRLLICINNRTIQHDMKGAEPIVYCFRKMR